MMCIQAKSSKLSEEMASSSDTVAVSVQMYAKGTEINLQIFAEIVRKNLMNLKI